MEGHQDSASLARRGAGSPFGERYAASLALLPLMVMLVLTFGGAGATGLAVWTAVLMIAFVACSPLRDGVAGHVIATGAGVLSFVAVFTGFLSFGWIDELADDVPTSVGNEVTWFVGVGGLLVALIIVSFVRQMARAERSHLIRGLSHSVLEGVALIVAPGWLFLPDLMTAPDMGADNMVVIVAVIVVALLFIGLAIASNWWMAEADPDEHARAPWAGIVVLPTLLTGALIPAATVVVALI
ncbi:hypothetical protein DSM100688_0687 [Bifidobacterium ramosum]|uniref:Uncharacterized protein n=1 Tax=Bifidobacterium ramosum TaxID=1798158 RepID=A0A6L4X3S0_9BIFI|nr:hypothetical protein [Bifidobacterium ramosum]KAB8288685.1 hypothetical protein DSM100688_0687 [Bifidobacterium ramosum]NEG71452.1 hypothetical protein [Bifidobacterium ramosum]